jgi:hypothetical protein
MRSGAAVTITLSQLLELVCFERGADSPRPDRDGSAPAALPHRPREAAVLESPRTALVGTSATPRRFFSRRASVGHFAEDTPTAVLVRQVLGAIAQFEKASLVAKMKAARDRKRAETGEKVGGRKSYSSLLGRRTVARLDQPARIMVQPVGERIARPTMTFLSIPTIFDAQVGQNPQRLVQTRRIHAKLAGADPFKRQGDFLGGRMDEVY